MYIRKIINLLASGTLRVALFSINALALIVAVALFIKAKPILDRVSLADLFLSSAWYPLQGKFGFFPFIVSTIEVTVLAMILAIPVCLLSAVYLSEYANRRIREFARLLIDIMAGIPSVVYGLCGVIVIVPFVQQLGESMGRPTTGYSLLAGSIVLAIMVVPFVISLSLEVMRTVPVEARESALSLGTTKWEMVKYVVLRSSRKGIAAAIVLGFSRAFGETMAVLMVVGNVARVPTSVFDPAYPLPALIANNYGEMMSIPLYDSALLLAALVLMTVVGAFSITAHLTLLRMAR
jgi:phosphate transport system permease protein